MPVCEKQTLYTQKHYTGAISCTKIIFMLNFMEREFQASCQESEASLQNAFLKLQQNYKVQFQVT